MSQRFQHINGHRVTYKDTGCEFAPSCLKCPFPNCIESKLKKQQLIRIRIMRRQGIALEEIAAEMGVTIAGVKWASAGHRRNYEAVTQ